MIDHFKDWLYYPLGILPSIFFSLRFILQWIKSERLKTSHINSTFWKLSICGNLLATIHYFIQMQYLFFFIQLINSFISRRNLVIMGKVKYPLDLITESSIFLMVLLSSSALFFFYSNFNGLESNIGDNWPLHLVGICGGFLFASRFWIQWWTTERNGISELNKHFWMLSILGGLLTIIYTIAIHDTISTINYSFGMIPYIRNLMLIRNKAEKQAKPA